ncbi:hypothetical protein ASD04_11220 [Devosia sp. Root436]|uniref:hypothetical protein n=1 Tax=Devosia sp. Root436 TaxID=1736537 RepID=UPI0006F5AF36|nr:hypothetical protein [Devosia sp. Root436]KQX38186.1 hypothetical protein ASD04_11220 [Devosia sp. Root436]
MICSLDDQKTSDLGNVSIDGFVVDIDALADDIGNPSSGMVLVDRVSLALSQDRRHPVEPVIGDAATDWSLRLIP